jgi:hypothetical protein
MQKRILASGSLEQLLPVIPQVVAPMDGAYLLYVSKDSDDFELDTPCAIVFSSNEDDDDFVPPEIQSLGIVAVAILEDVKDAMQVAFRERPSATASELLRAIKYFLDNDAFISFENDKNE